MDGSPTQELGNVTAPQAAEQQQQPAQNNTTSPSQKAINAPLHDRTMMDDSEDYGPLKKKHKYRDERDKERSGSFSHNSPPKKEALLEDDNVMTLDASLPIDTSNSAAADSLPPLSKTEPSTVAIPAPDSQHQTSAQQQQQLSQLTQQQDEHNTHSDLASSPGSTSEKNRRHKHNFYVPSRELAMLLDSGAAAAAAGSGSGNSVSGMGPISNTSRSDSEHNNHNAGEGSTAASSSSLLAGAGAITGRQAQKIAAMEAKEQARLQKEKEAEELRVKRKLEADKKKAETARRKAEREQKAAAAASAAATTATAAAATPATVVPSPGQAPSGSPLAITGTAKPKKKTTSQSKPSSQPAMPTANAASPSNISAELVTARTDIDKAPAEPSASNSASASKDVKPKKPAAARKALSKAKTPKGASPELAAPAALSSPDVKVGLAPSPLSQTIAIPLPGSVPLPPLPLPDISTATTEADDSDVLGFIPYASEGARAAALAKAAKQKAAAEGTLSTGGKGTGSKSSNTANGVASGSTNGNKRAKGEGKSRSAASKAKAAGGSGRASPVAGNEQLNNSQNDITVNSSTTQAASGVVAAEEDEVDDRLYCICQQLYDQERLMIACDRCDNWYHADCINIEEASIELIDLFICPICEKGRSVTL